MNEADGVILVIVPVSSGHVHPSSVCSASSQKMLLLLQNPNYLFFSFPERGRLPNSIPTLLRLRRLEQGPER